MASGLCVAILGDSWVSDFERGENADWWKLESPLPYAVADGLVAHGVPVSKTLVCGFPGFTASRLLDLAQRCSLRDMAKIQARKGFPLPIRGTLGPLLSERGVSGMWAGSWMSEEVDIVVIIAGYNDLKYREANADQVARFLFQLQDLYTRRDVEPIIVSIGAGKPCLDRQRARVNELLFSQPGTVDCDVLVNQLGDGAWCNKEHFTADGYVDLGHMLARAIKEQLSATLLNRCRTIKSHTSYARDSWDANSQDGTSWKSEGHRWTKSRKSNWSSWDGSWGKWDWTDKN